MSIFDHPAFDPRHEVKVHVLMLVIAIVIAVLSIVRMTQPVPFTRGQIIGITMVRRIEALPATPCHHIRFLLDTTS